MIRTLENQDKKLYYVSSSDWECVVLSKDAIEAAGEAFEEAFDTFGQNLNLSSCVKVINCTGLQEKHLIEPEHQSGVLKVPIITELSMPPFYQEQCRLWQGLVAVLVWIWHW